MNRRQFLLGGVSAMAVAGLPALPRPEHVSADLASGPDVVAFIHPDWESTLRVFDVLECLREEMQEQFRLDERFLAGPTWTSAQQYAIASRRALDELADMLGGASAPGELASWHGVTIYENPPTLDESQKE